LVELAPPKVKKGKPETQKRNLMPLPEIRPQNSAPTKESTAHHEAYNRLRTALQPREQNRRPTNLPPTYPRLSRDTQTTRTTEPHSAQKARKRPGRSLPSPLKRALNIFIPVLVVSVLIIMVILRFFSTNAFAVFVDDVHVGYMTLHRETTSESFHNEVVEHLEAIARTGVIVSQQVSVDNARWVSQRNILERPAMISRIGIGIDYQIRARAIHVNNNLEVVVRSAHCVAEIERLMQEPFRTADTVYMSFDTDWRVEEMIVDHDYEGIYTPLDAIGILDRTEIVNHTHIIQSGDTLEHIANRFGTTASSIATINNITLDTIIHPGNTLTVRTRRPLLSVRAIDETASYYPIEMPVEERFSPYRDESTTYIVQEGSSGEERVVRRQTRINNIIISTETLEAEVIREPVPHIVEIGTRPAVIERR
jgi:LysM repeat protein